MLLDIAILALRNLTRQKLRSWLTILGVIIGISAIVALISISVGMKKYVSEEFEKLGKDKITVLPGKSQKSMLGTALFGKGFSEKEIEDIEKVKGVEVAAPLIFKTATVVYKDTSDVTFVYGLPVDKMKEIMETIQGYSLEEGKYLRKSKSYEAVLGYGVAKYEFGKEIEVGDKIVINGVPFKVIGILNKIGSRFDDYSIYIPYDAAKEVLKADEANLILVKAKGDPEDVAKEIEKVLKKDRKREDFTILTTEELSERIGSILSIITAVVVGIAGISLIVGATGIMNTMYMAVTERTREIGILKAIGAKKIHIFLIFLLESGFIGCAGGLLGITVGLGFAKAAEVFVANYYTELTLPFKTWIDIKFLVGMLAFSFSLGMVSGILPARKAANLVTVKALRYE